MKLLDNLGLSRFLTNCNNRFAKKNHTHPGSGGGLIPVELERFDVGDPNTYVYYLGTSTSSALYTAIVANVNGIPSSGGDLYNYTTLQILFDGGSGMINGEQCSPLSDIDGWLLEVDYNIVHTNEFTAYVRLNAFAMTDESLGLPLGTYIQVQNLYQAGSNPSEPPNRPFKIVKLFKQEATT